MYWEIINDKLPEGECVQQGKYAKEIAMNSEQLKQLKKINAAAVANSKPEMSALTIKVVLGLAAVGVAVAGLVVIIKAAGL